MGDFAFQPVTLQVTAGTTVVWDNDDTMPHTVTSGANRTADGKFDSGDLQPGRTFSYTFTKPGVYPYYCVYHPTMNGTVVVRPASAVATARASSGSRRTAETAASGGDMRSVGMMSTAAPAGGVAGEEKVAPLGTGTAGEPKLPDGLRLLPYKVENGYKVFHLTLQPVWWQVKPGSKAEAWAFNGTVPGPEIRVNQGDKVKVEVTNRLPEGTSVHWHGLDLPFDQDGVGGLSQPDIQPGHSWTYTFTVKVPPGSYMYHAHPMNDMMKQ